MTILVKPLLFKPHRLNGLSDELLHQPLREQLRRRAAPAECDPGEAGGARLAVRAGVRDQRHEARGADRRRLRHPA